MKAYEDRRLVIEAPVMLREMPRWNTEYQAIELSKKDMGALERKTKELIEMLKK